MSRLQLAMARLLGVTALVATILGGFRLHPLLGVALLVAAGIGWAGYLLREELARFLDRTLRYLGRPLGRVGLALLCAWIVTAPAILFFDPATLAPNSQGHIDRDPREFYQLVSDDAAYVAASRTWDRTVANLLVPHNTHIVPAWRLVTWTLVALAGNLQNLPYVLAIASYGILVAVMLMAGRLVARETGRAEAGLAVSALVGTTSLMLTPASWYSGGQPLWAGFGILSALWYAQSFRRSGRWTALALSAVAAGVAGGFWSAGHLAGPVTAVYLWFDGRRRCRLAAAVPPAATAAWVVLLLALAARPMDSTVSFHGRTVGEAADPVQGAITTAQAIPGNLILANLGLDSEPTPVQGVVMTLSLLAIWASRRWHRRAAVDSAHPEASSSGPVPSKGEPPPYRPTFAFNPLESAGIAIVIGCYLLEWTFRGYLDHHNLRTINPYAIVPWYDAIPQIGAALFAVGWWSGPNRTAGPASRSVHPRPSPPTRSAALTIALATLVLIALNRPRIDTLIRGAAPPLVGSEEVFFKVPRLVTMRASAVLSLRVNWQRTYLRRLDLAEAVARRMGIGQDGIRAAFGFLFIPGSTGRLLQTQRELYDVAAILNIPPRGRISDPEAIRAALGAYLRLDPEPRPPWILPGEAWPKH